MALDANEYGASDEELLRNARSGDVAAFERFYRRHRDWAIRVARSYTADVDTAIDITQAVFCRFLDRIEQISIQSSATGYLAASIRNEALTRERLRGSTRALCGEEPVLPPLDTPSEPLNRALARLPSEQREILILWAEHGLTHVQIAEALEIPLGTVKTRSRAALAALRADLGDDFEKV